MVLCGAAVTALAEPPPCVEVSTETPYRGYGYTHIVVLASSCERDLRCEVASDVDPAWQEVALEAGATERVVLRSGSPARTFTPRVRCR